MATFYSDPTSTPVIDDVYDESGSLAGSTAHTKVNDDSNTTYLRQFTGNKSSSQIQFGLTTYPDAGPIGSIDTMNCRCTSQVQGGWSDDGLTMQVAVFTTDGLTALTETLVMGTDPGGTDPLPEGSWLLVDKPFVFTTAGQDPANWPNPIFVVDWAYTKVKGDDNAHIALGEIELTGTYTEDVGHYPVADSLVNAGAVQSGAVGQSHTTLATTGLTSDSAVQGASVNTLQTAVAVSLVNTGAVQSVALAAYTSA